MRKKTVELNGAAGIVGLVLAIGFASMRFIAMSDVKDESLRRDLSIRLSSGETARFMEQLEDSKAKGDFTHMADAIEELQNPIKFHSIKISSPLLEWSNKQAVVVRVEYSPPGLDSKFSRVKYLRYKKRGISSWEYRGPTGALSYYMNFF